LLSDPHDPFNRQPLSIEDVIEATELRGKINEWRQEMKLKAQAAKAGEGQSEKMDTTDG